VRGLTAGGAPLPPPAAAFPSRFVASLGKDQPDPHGSPGGQAVQPVFDYLSGLWINGPELLEPWSDGLELLKAGNLRIDLPSIEWTPG